MVGDLETAKRTSKDVEWAPDETRNPKTLVRYVYGNLAARTESPSPLNHMGFHSIPTTAGSA